MATIAHVNPVSWSIEETTLVRNALDTMLRGGPGRNDDRRDIRTWFQLYDQDESSASSSNTGYRDHHRSLSHSRGGRPTSPPRRGMVSAQGQVYNREQGQQSQNFQSPYLQRLQDCSTTGRSRLNPGAGASDTTAKRHPRNQQTPGHERSSFRPSHTSHGRESGRPMDDHDGRKTAGTTPLRCRIRTRPAPPTKRQWQ